MRLLAILLVLGSLAGAQQGPDDLPNGTPAMRPQQPELKSPATRDADNERVMLWVPAGTKVPLALKHAISTKNAKPGDSVYAQTTFPVVINERILIPAGTYVQGNVSAVKRPGRIKGKPEMLFNFTTLIFPNGYTVVLPSSIEQIPGMEQGTVKDEEGTVQGAGSKGKDAKTIGIAGAAGAQIGAVAGGGTLKGAAIGGGLGAAVGTVATLVTRGPDLRIEAGTAVEMQVNRAIALDPARLARQ